MGKLILGHDTRESSVSQGVTSNGVKQLSAALQIEKVMSRGNYIHPVSKQQAIEYTCDVAIIDVKNEGKLFGKE